MSDADAYTDEVEELSGVAGEKIEAFFVTIAALMLNAVRVITLWFGALGMFALDAALTPQMGVTPRERQIIAMISFLASGFQILAWRWWERNGGKEILKNLDPFQKGLIGLVALVALVDTYFDMKGYNSTLYGTTDFIIPDPNSAWKLTFVMVFMMCSLSEPFSSQIFRRIQKGQVGGFSDGGGGFLKRLNPFSKSS